MHVECTFRYVKQPPPDVACDPYSFDSTGISLHCQVAADVPSSSYAVNWYYTAPSAAVSTLLLLRVTSSARDIITRTATTSLVTTNITLQLRQSDSVSSPGTYYCQVEPVDTSIQTIPSDSFMLYSTNSGHYVPVFQCDSNVPQFKNEIKCAVETSRINCSCNEEPITPNSRTEMDDVSTAFPTEIPTRTTNHGGEDGTNMTSDSSSILGYKILAYVLAPVAVIMVIILLVIGVVYACTRVMRQKTKCEEQKQDTVREESRERCKHQSWYYRSVLKLGNR